MALPVSLDHCVIKVTNWERSNAFYRDVMGAILVERPAGWAYRFGDRQLNVHGPGVRPAEVARLPVQPGNSDLCFEWVRSRRRWPILSATALPSSEGRWNGLARRAPAPVSISAIPTAR
jgi:catechol 2,3-dioxygenase-like lactoylglutathione lyase family enzyme